MTPLRIGVWFDASHCSYGGPTAVLLGTLLGFKQLREDVVVLLNEPGDINWSLNGGEGLRDVVARAPRLVVGPMALTLEHGEEEAYAKNPVWKYADEAVVVVPTEWVRQFIYFSMPYGKPDGGGRRLSLWPSGVDTNFFSPSSAPKTQDFFIYYKSQAHADLHRIHALLFRSYFHLRGSVLTYYCYTPEMLRTAARASRFCIVLDKTETQGLAALEIMACDCPLFVLDCTQHQGQQIGINGASSCPCWADVCGVKTSWERLEADFAAFLPRVDNYKPRAFVESTYSHRAAAASLLSLARS
jgi:hypothetical protein